MKHFYSRAEKTRLYIIELQTREEKYKNRKLSEYNKTPSKKNFTLMMNVKHTHLKAHNH